MGDVLSVLEDFLLSPVYGLHEKEEGSFAALPGPNISWSQGKHGLKMDLGLKYCFPIRFLLQKRESRTE